MQYNCFTCPLGKKDYEQRLELSKSLNEEPDYHEIAYSIWCDKTGSKSGLVGFCDEAIEEDIKPKQKMIKQRSSKRTRREKHMKRLKYLSEVMHYPYLVMSIEGKVNKELGCYVPLPKPYYKKLYRGNHKGNRYKYYKRHANKVVRKFKGELQNGNSYRKVYDYWWTVD